MHRIYNSPWRLQHTGTKVINMLMFFFCCWIQNERGTVTLELAPHHHHHGCLGAGQNTTTKCEHVVTPEKIE